MLAAAWLVAAGAALYRPRRAWAVPLTAVLALLLWLAPAPGPSGPAWLRFSPCNLVPEPDLVRLGLQLFYPGQRERILAMALPYYGEAPQASAVHFTATDVIGLGTGSGHRLSYSPGSGRPLLLFLHGALGNFQSYLAYWRGYGDCTVVCPTFGFGRWYRPGGTETALAAVDWAHQEFGCPPGATLLAGMSNGATGAVRAVAVRPQEFAALVLISPVLEPERVTDPAFLGWARTHPVLVLEGSDDVNVRPASVERGVGLMRAAGVRVDYRLLSGHDHFLMFSAQAEVFRALRALR